jgi:integral membrane protein
MRPENPITFLRRVSLAEGISFLVLLGVAMPLKYLANIPEAVKVAGWVHGVLFMALCAAVVYAKVAAKWPATRAAMVLVAGLLPFGPFVVDRRMKGYEDEYRARVV